MKKRLFLFIFLGIFAIFTLCSFTTPLSATDESTDTTTDVADNEENIGVGKVVISETKNGTITTSILEGKIGDLVQISVDPDILYVLSTLNVNGAILEPLEDGSYEFALAEGDNVIEATFIISDEKLNELADLLESVKQGDWKDIFSFENVFTFINWFITAFCSIGFFKTLIKSKKYKTLTTQQILDNVNDTINKKVAEGVTNVLKDFFGPFVDTITSKIDGISDSTKIMTRCFILMQEGTPQSRLAILDELSKIKDDEDALTVKVKNLIANEITKNEQKIAETQKSIEELKQVNEENVSETTHL